MRCNIAIVNVVTVCCLMVAMVSCGNKSKEVESKRTDDFVCVAIMPDSVESVESVEPEPVAPKVEKIAEQEPARNNQYIHNERVKTPDGFARHSHKYKRKYKKIDYKYEVDFMQPKDSTEYSEEFARWVIKHLENSIYTNKPVPYEGNPYDAEAVMKSLANRFFRYEISDDFESERECESYVHDNFFVEHLTERYVTYYEFYNDYQCMAAHDYYVIRYVTYDLVNQKELTNQEIFRQGALNDVKELLFQTALADDYYRRYGDSGSTIESVRKVFTGEESVENWQMPNAALLKEGVVFCFQPYQIGCFAAGAFQFFIPYSKVRKYLTDYCKELLE